MSKILEWVTSAQVRESGWYLRHRSDDGSDMEEPVRVVQFMEKFYEDGYPETPLLDFDDEILFFGPIPHPETSDD